MATNVYHLVPQWMGFAGLALVTASALGLALRFGAPSALLGLVGGLAAPVLVGEQSSSVAPLTLYLALVVAGLSAVARRQRWPWLSAAALAGGFGWSILLIGLQRMDSGNSAALGVYALLLAFALPLLATGFGHERLLRAAAAVIGTVQLALIVSMGSYSLFNWGLYGLLSLAAIMLARFDSRLSWLPLVALGIGLLTMLGWSNPPLWHLALVSGMAMLMFAVPPLLRPARWPEALQQALAWAGPVLIARMIVPESVLSDDRWGWIALAVLLPLAGSALRTVGQARAFAILTVAATLMLGAGLAALLPMRLLALAFAIVLAALTELRCRHAGEYRPALALAAVLVAMALSAPTAQWLLDTLLTLDGRPFYFGRAMLPSDVLLILLLPPVLIGYALWRYRAPFARVAIGLPGMLLLIGLFYLYKQLFRIEGASDFLLRGMAERVLLTQLFCAAAWLAWRRGLNVVAAALATIALLRVGLYDMFIFNPIWRDQLVDQLPLANLLAPAYLFPAAWLWLARPAIPERWVGPALPAMDVGQMLLILFFAAASIRQLFHGSLIAVGGVSEGENFAYSAAAILIALGFLRWGIFRRDRLWRIASLVLMLFAVGKVFLSDAAGLDGLLRIASFVGLGLSLIGIGWLYSRHVRPDDQPAR